jgi:hypothetical protein
VICGITSKKGTTAVSKYFKQTIRTVYNSLAVGKMVTKTPGSNVCTRPNTSRPPQISHSSEDISSRAATTCISRRPSSFRWETPPQLKVKRPALSKKDGDLAIRFPRRKREFRKERGERPSAPWPLPSPTQFCRAAGSVAFLMDKMTSPFTLYGG